MDDRKEASLAPNAGPLDDFGEGRFGHDCLNAKTIAGV
jgi:hypothetical protein